MTALLKYLYSVHRSIFHSGLLASFFVSSSISALARRYQICNMDQTPYLSPVALLFRLSPTRCPFLCSYHTYLGHTRTHVLPAIATQQRRDYWKILAPPRFRFRLRTFLACQPTIFSCMYIQIQSFKKNGPSKGHPMWSICYEEVSPNRTIILLVASVG